MRRFVCFLLLGSLFSLHAEQVAALLYSAEDSRVESHCHSEHREEPSENNKSHPCDECKHCAAFHSCCFLLAFPERVSVVAEYEQTTVDWHFEVLPGIDALGPPDKPPKLHLG